MTDLASLMSLQGHTAVVTGGGGAIGGAIVRILSQAGARVISVDRHGHEAPGGVESLPCDLSDPDAIDRLTEEIGRLSGSVHILVHCAGITADAVLWKMTTEQWSDVMRVNLDSAFHLLRGIEPMLRSAGRGSVVLIASINAQRGKFGQANYAASKAGLIGLGKTAARELGPRNIRVNCIAPGFIDSPMTRDLPPRIRERASDESILGRVGRPEDVAGVVLFLCSSLSQHVTGQVIRVDGGQLIA